MGPATLKADFAKYETTPLDPHFFDVTLGPLSVRCRCTS